MKRKKNMRRRRSDVLETTQGPRNVLVGLTAECGEAGGRIPSPDRQIASLAPGK